MIKPLSILIFILFFSCEDKNLNNSLISNEAQMNTEYRINLNWNEDEERLKTGVNIIWNEWEENPLFTFMRYEIKDVSTERDKLLYTIYGAQTTTQEVEFPTGTFYRLCVLAYYSDSENNENIISSDSTQFFTQPLSPIINLSINAQPLENGLTWNPSSDQNINKLIIYRAEIFKNYSGESDTNAPTLEASMIASGTGEIEDSLITYNGDEQIGVWKKMYDGINLDGVYNDLNASDPNYTYYYTINVQIEETEGDSIIANYRYSIIVPENKNDEINLIQEQNINLSTEIDQDNIIILTWDIYSGNDFYSYEIWRTDIESMDIESLEDNGEKIVEITHQTQYSFEDINLVGSEKSFYYFIRVNNNYGDTIESNIIEGDTTL